MRCVIVGAAEINNYNKIKSFLKSDDFAVFCDGGLNHQKKLGLKPDLIVGDFDSHARPETSAEIIQLPHMKDDTDSFYAVKEAYNRGFTDFLLLGMIGQRFDHSLCNISMLLWLHDHNCTALLLDDYSEMKIIGPESIKNPVQIPDCFSYFSLMLPAGDADGITIKDALYPLANGKMDSTFQLGISNEVLKGKTASVSVAKGKLLLICVW